VQNLTGSSKLLYRSLGNRPTSISEEKAQSLVAAQPRSLDRSRPRSPLDHCCADRRLGRRDLHLAENPTWVVGAEAEIAALRDKARALEAKIKTFIGS
jgi:hypothetical protein